LEFSEIVTSFLDIIALSVFIGVYAYIQKIFMDDKETIQSNNRIYQMLLKENNFFKIVILYIKYLKVSLIVFLIVIIGSAIYSHFDKSFDTYMITVFGIICCSGFLVVIVNVENARKHAEQTLFRRRQLIDLAIFLMLFMGIDFVIASLQAHQIKVDKSTYGFVINLDNGVTLKSDTSNYYIGSTKNYVFFYHQNEKTSDIIPMVRVKSMTFINHAY
jgi:hypothetical protein